MKMDRQAEAKGHFWKATQCLFANAALARAFRRVCEHRVEAVMTGITEDQPSSSRRSHPNLESYPSPGLSCPIGKLGGWRQHFCLRVWQPCTCYHPGVEACSVWQGP